MSNHEWNADQAEGERAMRAWEIEKKEINQVFVEVKTRLNARIKELNDYAKQLERTVNANNAHIDKVEADLAAEKAESIRIDHHVAKQDRRITALRGKLEKLRDFAHTCSLDEYESTTSASEKVRSHARKAREVLKETE